MIHLDTNALIALPQWARDGHPIVKRVVEGEPAVACSVVWYEFLLGPLTEDEARLAHAFLQGRIAPVTEDDAMLAAELFDRAGRSRRLKTDALIAAMAIRANADFVTLNAVDFQPFVGHGLRLLPAD